MSAEQLLPAASVAVSLIALGLSTILLTRQNKQLEHERNALAILEAINRLTDAAAMGAFEGLQGVNSRYPTDEDILEHFDNSDDDRALLLVAQYFETVATLARRKVLDASLLVDAVGYMIRVRWETIRDFIFRLRRIRGNQYIFENFEWLAMYSAWWRELPRPPGDTNYDEKQFGDLEFKV
ncbi:MAG: DUF4760 domain-containing protein [Candidatus Eremiobacteraeota bacterium]|nr:DUF4760 domain-containing protein [Candidatus Eremiobacteraeota bacterium]MBV9699146.1 DUF4760 domain-containing protein [Candidatus Eremiobacteraeota bacterium]